MKVDPPCGPDLEQARERIDELERQVAALEKPARLGALTRGMVHDFNNALTGVLSFAELVEETLPPEDSEARLYAQKLLEAVNSARDLVGRMREEVYRK